MQIINMKRKGGKHLMKNLLNNCKGITLIALAITIIVLLILAGVTIASLTGDNGIIFYASKAKFITEIREIEEKINLMEMEEKNTGYLKFGTLSDLIGVKDTYNEILYVENGELVYQTEKVSKIQKQWLEEIEIKEKQGIIPIYTEEQLQLIGTGNTVLVKEAGIEYHFTENGHYVIQNDIEFECNEEKQWIPISNFQGILDGQNHKVSILDCTLDYGMGGLINQQNGIVKNLNLNLKIKANYGFGRNMPCK